MNSAVKRDFLINTIGYADVPYSEDQQFGRDIIDAGYIKVYSGVGAVIHSNDVELKHYKNRLFDEVYNMRKLSGKTEKLPFSFVMKQILVTSWRDGKKIMAEKIILLKRSYIGYTLILSILLLNGKVFT